MKRLSTQKFWFTNVFGNEVSKRLNINLGALMFGLFIGGLF